jgi:xanthine dehydrogenase iron-sulfur cluster and FAD-binding subunit A
MKSFQYLRISSAAEACQALAPHGADVCVLAGGTDLLIEWRRTAAKLPPVVVDISPVEELRGILEDDDAVVVKPLTTHSQLLRSDLLQQFAPLLASAAASIGSPQIRHRGTVGGNLMNAASCADTVPPLVALGAVVTLQSAHGTRQLNLAELFVKPYQTVARADEILTGIRFPKLPPRSGSAFIKLGRRNALAISRLSVAAVLQLGDDGRIAAARIVPGAAFPTWRRVTEAEEMLIGEKPDGKLFAAAGAKVSEVMIKETGRRWSTEYKEPVIAVLVRRALEQAVAQVSKPAVPPISKSAERGKNGGHSACERSAGLETRDTAGLETCATITATINGRLLHLAVPSNRTLLELLRDDLGLTGTKCGCEVGECGACTVLLDGEPVNSCLVLAPQIQGRHVATVEGLAPGGKLHPLQEKFLVHDAVHCGFCTPGILMSAKFLLDKTPHPTETEIRTAISGNLCRCTGYQQIVDAIAAAATQYQNRTTTSKPTETMTK